MDADVRLLLARMIAAGSARISLATALLLALALLSAPSSAVEPSTDHDVVIVGAGASGLYAAYILDNLGYDVLVVEASDEHGGRVHAHFPTSTPRLD